jgi:hypothetical protein
MLIAMIRTPKINRVDRMNLYGPHD